MTDGAAAIRKKPFAIDLALERVSVAIRLYKKAALFELAERGYRAVFEQLLACIISVRTRDEVTILLAERLLQKAPTPEKLLALTPEAIEGLIRESTFARAKARNMHRIAQIAVDDYGGELPCDASSLLALPGVGPKCAHLVLGIACQEARISVDIHVHRVVNRWGYVQQKTPEKTLKALEAKLPLAYWTDLNRLVMPFGKNICTGTLPHCSRCVLLDMCPQIGVARHR